MTTIILGAGATRGAYSANHNILPPLLADLKTIPSCSCVSLNDTKDGPLFAEGFEKLIEACGLENNIEEFLSIIFVLEIIAERKNPGFVFLNREQIEQFIKYPKILIKVFPKREQRNTAIRILSFLKDNPSYSSFLYPKNLRTFFHSALRDYFAVCLSSCYCQYHAKLFKKLEVGDSVISFNYDEIADYTLHHIGKLSYASFKDLGFSDVILPNNKYPEWGIKLIKVHGSFNWWTKIENFTKVYYCLIPQNSSKVPLGNTPFPIVLPTINKIFYYSKFPVLHTHYQKMLESIAKADKLFIVGKSFLNADKELCNDIVKVARTQHKELYIIDPNVNEIKFLKLNEKIFSGSVICTWKTLKDFYESSDS